MSFYNLGRLYARTNVWITRSTYCLMPAANGGSDGRFQSEKNNFIFVNYQPQRDFEPGIFAWRMIDCNQMPTLRHNTPYNLLSTTINPVMTGLYKTKLKYNEINCYVNHVLNLHNLNNPHPHKFLIIAIIPPVTHRLPSYLTIQH